MKKFLSTVLASIMIVVTLGVSACKPKNDNHEHTFASAWSTSETEHWHAATCEHNKEVSDRAAHDFEVAVTRVSTAEEAGEAVYTCKVCKYSKTVALQYGNHEHIVGWTATRAEHTQSYICCDAQLSEPAHGAHTYGNGAVCSACGTYSVLEDASDKLNNGIFSYTLVVDNIDLPLTALSEDNSDIMINGGAFKLGLDENYMLTLVGTFNGSVSEYIEVAPEQSDKVTSLISGKIVIENNKVYVISKAEEGAMRWEKYTSGSDSFYSVGEDEQEFYAVYDLNKKLAMIGVDDFNTVFETVLDEMYGYSNELKAVLDTSASFDKWFVENFNKWFVENTDGTYTLNFGVINEFNDKAKDATIGSVLAGIFGKKYSEAIGGMITVALNLTVGDLLDFAEAQGVDIYELNAQLNALIAAYYPGEDSTIEEILASYGFPIADGLLLADYIDSKIVRAYKVIDVINMIGKAMAEEGTTYEDVAVEDIVALVGSLIETYENQKVYDVAGNLISMLLSLSGNETTINGSNIYTIIDEIGKLLSDCVHINVKLDGNKLVEVSIEISYTEPEEPAGEATGGETVDGEGTDAGETEEPDQLNETIKSITAMARMAIGNFTIKLSLNDSEVGIDANEVKNTVNGSIKTGTPTKEALKTALEESGRNTVEISPKDGKDYVTVIAEDTGSFGYVYNNGDTSDYLTFKATVKFGGYVDELLDNVNYYDRCGDSFIVYFDVALDVLELVEVKYSWSKTRDQYLTDAEVEIIRNDNVEKMDDYPELFGEYNDPYKIRLCFKYTKADGFTVTAEYSKDCDPIEIDLHEYELISGETEKINATYYTKFVYKCKHCNKTVIYYVSDANIPYVENAAA